MPKLCVKFSLGEGGVGGIMRFMCIFYDIHMCSLMCETNMSVV